MRSAATTATAALMALALAGCAEEGVVRVVGGHEVEGRFISVDAYAYYARGADAEARGNLVDALAAYQEASRADPESAEVWTRIGAAECKAGADAAPAFARAEALAPDDAAPRVEEARCLLARREVEAALLPAAQAMVRDPSSDEAALLHAQALLGSRRVADAQRELVALTVRRPGSLEAWEALAHAAALSGLSEPPAPKAEGAGAVVEAKLDRERAAVHPSLHARAAARAREIAAQRGLPPPLAEPTWADATASSGLGAIDDALRRGDLAAARSFAKRAHVAAAEVAVRAAALGRTALAREQGALVAAADPDDVSSRIALAVAAELDGDTRAAARSLASIAASGKTAPSPLARFVLADMLLRRAGADAARAYLGPTFARGPELHYPHAAGDDGGSDPLRAELEQRLRERLCACACPCPDATAALAR